MLMLTRGLQPNVVEKGDVSTLKLHGVLLAINLDREREKKLQSTVPDVVGAEQNFSTPGGRTKTQSSRLNPQYF